MAQLCLLPKEGTAVDVPGISRFFGVIVIGVIVEAGYLIPAVDHGNPGQAQHIAVEQQIQGDRLFEVLRIFAFAGCLNAAEGGSGAAEPGIS